MRRTCPRANPEGVRIGLGVLELPWQFWIRWSSEADATVRAPIWRPRWESSRDGAADGGTLFESVSSRAGIRTQLTPAWSTNARPTGLAFASRLEGSNGG